MKNTEFAMEMLERAQERFEDTFDQMTIEEANQMPAPLIKSVVWLMWHTARELDMQISDLNGTDFLWTSAGWSEKFALDLPDDTPDYLAASIEFTKEYLKQLDESSLNDVIDTNWDPPVTRQVRIVSAIDDAVMHSGQAVYTRRMVIGK